MVRMLAQSVIAISVALLVNASALAQSINIDIDSPGSPASLGGGAPSSGFGAASGQTGFWNAYPGQQTVTPFALSDLGGASITATLTRTINSGSGSVNGFNNGTMSGDYALLMKDASQVGTTLQGGWNQYDFRGLQNGSYQVWTYGAPPSGGAGFTPVSVIGSPDPIQTLTGNANNNLFIYGQTHAIHDVMVTTGELTVRIDVPANAGAAAYISGFQLVHTVPTPGAIALFGLGGLFSSKRRRS